MENEDAFKGNPDVDWSILNQYPPDWVECVCGERFASRFKFQQRGPELVGCTQVPCPKCGKEHGHVKTARSGPFEENLKGYETIEPDSLGG